VIASIYLSNSLSAVSYRLVPCKLPSTMYVNVANGSNDDASSTSLHTSLPTSMQVAAIKAVDAVQPWRHPQITRPPQWAT